MAINGALFIMTFSMTLMAATSLFAVHDDNRTYAKARKNIQVVTITKSKPDWTFSANVTGLMAPDLSNEFQSVSKDHTSTFQPTHADVLEKFLSVFFKKFPRTSSCIGLKAGCCAFQCTL